MKKTPQSDSARLKKSIKSYQFHSRKLHRHFLEGLKELEQLKAGKDYYERLSQRYFSDINKKTYQLKEAAHQLSDLNAKLSEERGFSQEKNATIEQLQEQHHHIRQQLIGSEAHNRDLIGHVNTLSQDIAALQQKNEALIQQNHVLSEEILAKDSKIDQLEEIKRQFETELASRDAQIDELNRHLDAVEKLADDYWKKNKKLVERIEELSSSFTFKLLYKDKLDYEEK